ncbi:PilZ domain-containing protein, partial [Acidithiobacillus caldus]
MAENPRFQPLRDFLPSRSGLHLVDFQNVFLGDNEKYSAREPLDLCRDVPADAILFSADPDDDGRGYLFTRCEDSGLFFLPMQEFSDTIEGQALAFIDGHTHISTFFAEILGGGGSLVHTTLPHLVYWRKKRFRARLSLDQRMVLGRRDGKRTPTRLINFSTGGVGFLTDIGDLQPGELVLMVLDLAACGSWEVLGVIVRTEPNLDAQYRFYAAARFQLLRAQYGELERIYRCLSGAETATSREAKEPAYTAQFPGVSPEPSIAPKVQPTMDDTAAEALEPQAASTGHGMSLSPDLAPPSPTLPADHGSLAEAMQESALAGTMGHASDPEQDQQSGAMPLTLRARLAMQGVYQVNYSASVTAAGEPAESLEPQQLSELSLHSDSALPPSAEPEPEPEPE